MGKYAPLTRFLRERDEPRVNLHFSELEEVLGFSLPGSAYKYASWWANSAAGQSQVKGWRDAGWETREVDLRGRKVTFVRVSGEPVAKPAASARRQPAAKPAASRRSPTPSTPAMRENPAAACEVAKLPPQARRLLLSRAARHDRDAREELAAIIASALAEERARLREELAGMREETLRPGAFDLLAVLGRR